MTISNRLMALGLVGSASFCVLLASQVSATVPPGGGRAEPAALPVCSPDIVQFARERAAGHMRMLALADVDPAPATNYVSGLRLVEQRKRMASHKAFLADERDSSIRTIAMCGQPTAIDRCLGYKAETAERLARDDYEYENEWRHRVERARAEAKLCGVTLPEAKDPGRDCTDDKLHSVRRRLAEFLREPLIDAATGTRGYRDERFILRLREHLTSCGDHAEVDTCFGFDRGWNEGMLRTLREYGDTSDAKRLEAELALCPAK